MLSNTSVNENSSEGTLVGTFSTVDSDANSSFTYTLNTSNVPFAISDNRLILHGLSVGDIDYETTSSYTIMNN